VAALGLSVATAAGFQSPALRTGLDLDTSGNTATSVGNVDGCRSVSVGDTFDVDVWVEDVPAASDSSGGVAGWGYNLLFDPKVLEITAVDNKSQMASFGGPPGGTFEVIDADAANGPQTVELLPATTGNLRVDFLILAPPSGYPSGSGVMSRLTVKAISSGTSDVTLADTTLSSLAAPQIFAVGGDQYPVASVQNGIVAVGQPCSGAPTPLVAGSGGLPSVEEQAGVTPPAASVTPQPSPAPGQTAPATASAQVTASASPSAGTPTPTGTGTPTPTGGGDTTLIVGGALVAVVAAAAVAGGALYLLRKRRAF
jgi:hypothetical protein